MHDTIAALATPVGHAGIGVIRISGVKAREVAQALLHTELLPRHATFTSFYDAQQQVIDTGIALFFKAPHSFTGEDVVELQGHGGPVVLDRLLKCVLMIKGVRLAKPGEFSERAFLNDKIDLVQAEAIADLIAATSEQAAKSAIASLQGEFSAHIQQLVDAVIHLRMFVEAALDFPDEEINFLADERIGKNITELIARIDQTLQKAKQGRLLRDGLTVVIAGKPNAGKSSLLNALSGRESAIVTAIPGTTRDVLREYIHLDGMPLHIIDTAGLRLSDDVVEQEGIKRALIEIEKADVILLLVDVTETNSIDPKMIWPEFAAHILTHKKIKVVQNKIDLQRPFENSEAIAISTKTGVGLETLKAYLRECAGLQNVTEGVFLARRRHIEALETAKACMISGSQQPAGELIAEELRLAQRALSTITGEFTSDDLLGKIFSEFCIGK